MITVEQLSAIEILDSRARPTLAVSVELAGGAVARAGVPSGASTGSREAKELRDGDAARFGGQGVLRAVAHVNGEIADAVRARSFIDLAELDATLAAIDWTSNKERLGRTRSSGCRSPLREPRPRLPVSRCGSFSRRPA